MPFPPHDRSDPVFRSAERALALELYRNAASLGSHRQRYAGNGGGVSLDRHKSKSRTRELVR